MQTLNLKGAEDAKIKCARKLFEQLGEGEVRLRLRKHLRRADGQGDAVDRRVMR